MLTRRQFCAGAAVGGLAGSSGLADSALAEGSGFDIVQIERDRVMRAAKRFIHEAPITITAYPAARSAGGPHDYFSEGDYWWPDPNNPDGPYIQRDGLTNPDNFVAHRQALIRLSVQMPALTAAWILTKRAAYARHAAEHLRAWFLSSATRMNPNLQYAQAIHGRATGRGIGIIDTIHLVEVTRAIPFLRNSPALSTAEYDQLQHWFADYLDWMTHSANGLEEREAKNNHGTCWLMQVAQFAHYTQNRSLIEYCTERYKGVLVPDQIAPDGSFPLELRRTKPYSYTLFNLDAFATICQILSPLQEDLWKFQSADGRGFQKAMAFVYPYLADKQSWPYPKDVQHFDEFPVRQPSLLFAGRAYGEPRYLALWRQLNPDPLGNFPPRHLGGGGKASGALWDPAGDEVVRNYPIRQPLLWL